MRMNYIIIYLVSLVTLVLLDYLWLGIIMRSWYVDAFGSLMRASIGYGYAGVFYILYAVGIVYFCIIPGFQAGAVGVVFMRGVFLGGLCYMTYDLTNAATLQDFPVSIIVPDILWGAAVTGVVAVVGHVVMSSLK